MKQRDILKYEKIMEDTLTDQVYISSLDKKSEKREKVEFICDVVSRGGHTKKMTVSVDFLDCSRADISYRTIIDTGENLVNGKGEVLAGKLTRKYRFIKNYITESVSDEGEKEYLFVAAYDCLLHLDDLDLFRKEMTYISTMYCSVLSDCIDAEQNRPKDVYDLNPFG